jgi:hypothetical protein
LRNRWKIMAGRSESGRKGAVRKETGVGEEVKKKF